MREINDYVQEDLKGLMKHFLYDMLLSYDSGINHKKEAEKVDIKYTGDSGVFVVSLNNIEIGIIRVYTNSRGIQIWSNPTHRSDKYKGDKHI